jgi:hypothetical protein
MATNTSDPCVEVAHYLAGLYEVQRDADRLPDTTGLLYGYVPDGHYCLVCLRQYEPRLRDGDGGRGGPCQRYCGPACRRRATDRRRRSLPREWRWCLACGGPFVALTLVDTIGPGQVACPPPWPASPFGRSACGEARRRETNREAKRRARARWAELLGADLDD